jgi:hypothetical protein
MDNPRPLDRYMGLRPRGVVSFDFPGPRDRVTVNGMTGSGKTTFAMWLFAESADFHKKPWIFVDYKRETIIQQALGEGLFEPLAVDARMPKKPGIYVVEPNPREGQGPVIDFLWRVYDAGRIGLFLDEATMIPELRGEANSGGPFQSILSQGRSKEIPTYVLAQRPVNVNLMVYTECNYYSAFKLKSKEDLKKVTNDIPEQSEGYTRVWSPGPNLFLPKYKYWSRWYDAQRNVSLLIQPSPGAEKILDRLAERIDKMKGHERI